MCYNIKKENMEIINMKKLLIMVMLTMTAVSCSLFDTEEWNEARERREERGRKCYETRSGYIYCEDKNGNRIY